MAKQRGQVVAPSGVYAALATPRQDGSSQADAAALLEYMDAVVRAGVNGLVLFGSTGEFVHFDLNERMRILSFALRRSRVPVLVNVSHSNLTGALELAHDAAGAGAAGLLLMPPYFYRYTGEQLLAFYTEFARQFGSEIPLYLYNLPQATSPIDLRLAEQLLRAGAFSGIKDSSGDRNLLESLLELRREQPFTLLAGNESLYLEARQAGADGIVSGVAAALPELPVAMDKAVLSGDTEQARRLNARLREFLRWVDHFPATVAIKQAAVMRGWKLDHAALPLSEPARSELAEYKTWLTTWLPSLLAECAAGSAVRA